MSFVPKITEEQAPAELKPLFGKIKEHYGFVPNYFQALARHPKLIEGQMRLAEEVLGDGALSPALKEEILLVVSGDQFFVVLRAGAPAVAASPGSG